MTKRIHLVQIGTPDPSVMVAISDAIRETVFRLRSRRVEIVRSPQRLGVGPFYDSARDQYSSRAMLFTLLDLVPEPDTVLGVTDMDLYQPILTYVFGEAQLRGRAALVSTSRLSQRWYGLPESLAVFYDRTIKEVLHELGHTWGLIHCSDYRCVMRASRVVEEIDAKDAAFCESCAEKLTID